MRAAGGSLHIAISSPQAPLSETLFLGSLSYLSRLSLGPPTAGSCTAAPSEVSALFSGDLVQIMLRLALPLGTGLPMGVNSSVIKKIQSFYLYLNISLILLHLYLFIYDLFCVHYSAQIITF